MVYNSQNFEISYTSKTFVIDHPIEHNKYLVHACLEGPESGVYYRGEGEITNNENVTIFLPNYVDKIANNLTIQITPIHDGKRKYYDVSRVVNNSFTVWGENGTFFWIVYGKRQAINVEPLKQDVQIKGLGPYKWI